MRSLNERRAGGSLTFRRADLHLEGSMEDSILVFPFGSDRLSQRSTAVNQSFELIVDRHDISSRRDRPDVRAGSQLAPNGYDPE